MRWVSHAVRIGSTVRNGLATIEQQLMHCENLQRKRFLVLKRYKTFPHGQGMRGSFARVVKWSIVFESGTWVGDPSAGIATEWLDEGFRYLVAPRSVHVPASRIEQLVMRKG